MTPVMAQPTIGIVEDHPVFAAGLKDALEGHGYEVRWAAPTASEAIRLMKEVRPEVVLLDIMLPDRNGITLCHEWKVFYPEVHIIGLTSLDDKGAVHQALEAGMDGYLLKNAGAETIARAIQTVASGGRYISPEIETLLKSRYDKAVSTPLTPVLTRREKEILTLILEELTTSEIALRLSISPATAETHRINLIRKMGARNTAGLVKAALELGLAGQ